MILMTRTLNYFGSRSGSANQTSTFKLFVDDAPIDPFSSASTQVAVGGDVEPLATYRLICSSLLGYVI